MKITSKFVEPLIGFVLFNLFLGVTCSESTDQRKLFLFIQINDKTLFSKQNSILFKFLNQPSLMMYSLNVVQLEKSMLQRRAIVQDSSHQLSSLNSLERVSFLRKSVALQSFALSNVSLVCRQRKVELIATAQETERVLNFIKIVAKHVRQA